MADRIDELMTRIGTGKWHVFHFVALAYSVYFPSPHALGGAFLAARQDYICDVSQDPDIRLINETDIGSCSYTIKYENGTAIEKKCNKWIFDNSTFTSTVTSEFELTCDREYLRATYQSIYMMGVLVGAPLNGMAADRFGRRTVFVIGSIAFTVMALVSAWMPNIPSLFLFRFLLGTMHPTLLKAGFILAVEVSEPRVRSLIGCVFFLPWSIGTMLWGGLAYLVRSWRWLQIYASLPCLVLMPVLWLIDESPRWLSVRGEHKRALQVFKKMARWNKVDLPSDEEIIWHLKESQNRIPKKEEKVVKERSAKDIITDFLNSAFILYRTPRVCFVNLVTHLSFFVFGMVYFGLALSGGNFNYNIFIYMALMGLMEAPACTFMVVAISRLGRKMPIACNLLLTGMVLLILPFLPAGIEWLAVTFAFIGKMTITNAFQASNLYGSELLPTEVRTRGLSTSFMLSRVGSSISPFITEILSVKYPWAPSVIFGGAAIIAGLALLTVWETLGMALPDTIDQMESSDFELPNGYLKLKCLEGRKIHNTENGVTDEERLRMIEKSKV